MQRHTSDAWHFLRLLLPAVGGCHLCPYRIHSSGAVRRNRPSCAQQLVQLTAARSVFSTLRRGFFKARLIQSARLILFKRGIRICAMVRDMTSVGSDNPFITINFDEQLPNIP